MTPYEIRSCAFGEAQAVLDLWRRAEATVSSTDTLPDVEALISGWPGALLVAAEGDVIVGSIIATFDGWRGHLHRLVVDTAYRRRGLGSALVGAAEMHLRKRGAKRVSALIESDHPLATSFWDASGYSLHEVMRRYYRSLETP